LVGLSQQDAEARLKALGLRAEFETRVDQGPAGIVLAQDPTEGTPLDGLASVRITVAISPPSEPKTTQVPDLMGRSEASAVDLVKTLGLEPRVAPTNDPAAREGVIGQEPAPGTVVKIGSAVLITVNRPSLPGPAVVAVPDLVGADVGKARQRLQGLGLVATEIQRPATAPLGQVLDQKPQAGAQVKAGSTVALVVSAGPAQKQPALDQLVRTMAAAPGAAKEGLDAQRLAQLFETAGATTIGDARALADLAPTALRDRLALGSVATATRLRAILKKSLTELG
jgi:serine/threonine-protein kinase